ncbi:hypothetical protein AH448_18600 [Salmonella enterica subsp. diarizonae]|nr:hypothetical protein [Salmonella enterica subsp. enterica serovar Sandiego]EAA8386577.1 hypothetical protein [Salmonella enterica]EAW1193430.1 hypothetical protein [Salmonella enterica subsp. enterica]EAW1825471.1 hypothetical protein [Salmonella enterica subsp. diarizonae]EBU8670263.1 hypothetical protein [Salmonella enterica subsp. enterica serovar Panama]EBV0540571.1 hypothetical protein [Salmonella enterica subsp. enterica serovar Glostrup]ECF2802306.1 hypothetical protein [Salmonella 
MIRVYILRTPAKSGVGIETPDDSRHMTARAVFLCVKHGYTKIMVGCVGQPHGWPVSWNPGSLNLAHFP